MSLRIKQGVYVALVTHFLENEDIDYISLKKLIDFQNKNKTTGIVLLGTTGESPTLSIDEKKN